MLKTILLSLMILFFVIAPAANAHTDRVDQLPTKVVALEAKRAIKNGATYSVRHGHCSSYLKRLSYELVERGFRPYGSAVVQWALSIVKRESGFCPGAVNTTYSDWEDQAKGLAQLIPEYHPWVNYKRMAADPWYAVKVFVKLSRGGRNTGPWHL